MKNKLLILSALVFVALSSCSNNNEPSEPSGPTYKVVFNSNGGSYIDSQIVGVGNKVNKPNDPTKNGYSFVTWTYKNQEWDFNNIVEEDMTLTARWSTVTYSINYNLDGGTNSSFNPTTYTIEDSFELKNPFKSGYEFIGWKLNDNIITSIQEGTTGNLTLYATWSINTYDVEVTSYDDNKGVVTGSGSYQLGERVTLTASAKPGFVFYGWFNGFEYLNDNTTYTFTMPASSLSFKAQFHYVNYVITYDLNGGENHPDNPNKYSIEDSFELYAPTKVGYTFTGWTLNGEIVTEIEAGSYGDIVLTANWSINSFEVVVNINDSSMGSVSGAGEYNYGSNVTLMATPNEGYQFDGWYENGTLVSEEQNYVFVMENTSRIFEAKMSIISYTITYKYNSGLPDTSKPNPKEYTINDSFTLSEPYRETYVFAGWYLNNEKITEIKKGTTGDLTISAYWKLDSYNVNVLYDEDGGTVNGAGNYVLGSDVTLEAIPNEGYSFNGWYIDGELYKTNTSIIVIPREEMVLEARWDAIVYSITYDLNGGEIPNPNPTTYTVNDTIVLSKPIKEGCEFAGWDKGNDVVINKIEKGTTGNLTLTAKWNLNKYYAYVSSSDESKGTITGAGEYEYQQTVSLVALPNDGCHFKGWYDTENNLVFSSDHYVFIMPSKNVTLIALFWSNEEQEDYDWKKEHGVIPVVDEENKTATYGLYPQTVVSDANLITTLDGLTEKEANGYYLYNKEYYTYVASASPKDSDYKLSDGQTIKKGKKYWFKCEPIEWRILESEDGEYFLFAKKAIDVHKYLKNRENRTVDGNKIRPSNYKYSALRAYLNGYDGSGYKVENYQGKGFADIAFYFNNENLLTRTVENGAKTTASKSNKYACADTEDKVFVLSYQQYINEKYGFNNKTTKANSARKAAPTDYALVKGAQLYKGYTACWSRTPDSQHTSAVYYTTTEGKFFYSHYDVDYKDTCIRPGIRINLPQYY